MNKLLRSSWSGRIRTCDLIIPEHRESKLLSSTCHADYLHDH
ncbi:hypothetical protein EV07_0654 [Prochlorococcus sp. MIT 0603]|nr:hypothetical protein EV07_0654 [Prochlorococcus sp. MIT 0603]